MKIKTGIFDTETNKEVMSGDFLIDPVIIDEDDKSNKDDLLMQVVWVESLQDWCIDVSFSKNGSNYMAITRYFKHLKNKKQ